MVDASLRISREEMPTGKWSLNDLELRLSRGCALDQFE